MQHSFRFDGKDVDRIRAATEILKQSSAVAKAVRAGFTTSAVLACEPQNLCLLYLAPTIRILEETVVKASGGDIIRIPGNRECEILKKEIAENKILEKIPMPLPECKGCEFLQRCEVRKILRVRNFNRADLTYAKLEALMLSKGETAKEILEKISKADVVIMDEAHVLALPSPVKVPVFTKLNIPDGYPMLTKISKLWQSLCREYADAIQELLTKAAKGYAQQHLAKYGTNSHHLEWPDMKAGFAELKEAAVKHEMPDTELLMVRDVITIVGANSISISFLGRDENDGEVLISASQKRLEFALRDFLQNHVPKARYIFSSGTLIEPRPGFFSGLSGKPVRNVIFPDLRGDTKKMTLIHDRWKLNSRNFTKKLPQIIEVVRQIAEQENAPVYVLAPNSRKARVIRQKLVEAGIKRVFTDYYRSDRTMGVERSERVCISIGMAEIPANACDTLARGNNAEEKWVDSRSLRLQAVHCATWQAVNRVRDPEGKVESRVYFVGCRFDQVQQVATWGTNRQAVLKDIEEKNGFGVPIFEIQTDQELELPKILADSKNRTRPGRRIVRDLVEKVELNNVSNINSENVDIFSILGLTHLAESSYMA